MPVSVQISFHLTECSQKGLSLHYTVGKENQPLCLSFVVTAEALWPAVAVRLEAFFSQSPKT